MDLELIRAARARWLQENLPDRVRAICVRNGIEIPEVLDRDLDEDVISNWGRWRWHWDNAYTNRDVLRDPAAFEREFPEFKGRRAELFEYLSTYQFSILPLNRTLQGGVRQFVPDLELRHALDPYGVKMEDSVILHEVDGKVFYVATHKEGYGSILPIMINLRCNIGCSHCYRGPETRRNEPLRIQRRGGGWIDVQMPTPQQQAAFLAEIWDAHYARVTDVLWSGGEPLAFPDRTWEAILIEMRKIKSLQSFRICTGALKLGLPWRITSRLIELLTAYQDDENGAAVKFAVHVAHPDHVTPESLMFTDRLREARIEILPQIPIQAGINFWVHDLEKSKRVLSELAKRLAFAVGFRPYKWIIDMQGGVPLPAAIEVWRDVHDSHLGLSDITRPTSFAVFSPGPTGNLNLSTHTVEAAEVEVDHSEAVVTYRIPHPSGGIVNITESLIPGVNDSEDCLRRLLRRPA